MSKQKIGSLSQVRQQVSLLRNLFANKLANTKIVLANLLANKLAKWNLAFITSRERNLYDQALSNRDRRKTGRQYSAYAVSASRGKTGKTATAERWT